MPVPNNIESSLPTPTRRISDQISYSIKKLINQLMSLWYPFVNAVADMQHNINALDYHSSGDHYSVPKKRVSTTTGSSRSYVSHTSGDRYYEEKKLHGHSGSSYHVKHNFTPHPLAEPHSKNDLVPKIYVTCLLSHTQVQQQVRLIDHNWAEAQEEIVTVVVEEIIIATAAGWYRENQENYSKLTTEESTMRSHPRVESDAFRLRSHLHRLWWSFQYRLPRRRGNHLNSDFILISPASPAQERMTMIPTSFIGLTQVVSDKEEYSLSCTIRRNIKLV